MVRKVFGPASIDECLARVSGETCRAAVLLAASRSARFVPCYEKRYAESVVQTGFLYMRDAIQMAGLVALCAVLEQSRRIDLINLRVLFARLADAEVLRDLAARRSVDSRTIHGQVEQTRQRYEKRVRPFIAEVKSIRDGVMAHHGRGEVTKTTFGQISRLAERTLVIGTRPATAALAWSVARER